MTINVVEAAAVSRERMECVYRVLKTKATVPGRQREKKGFFRLVQSIWYSFELELVGETLLFEISDQACSCRGMCADSVCECVRLYAHMVRVSAWINFGLGSIYFVGTRRPHLVFSFFMFYWKSLWLVRVRRTEWMSSIYWKFLRCFGAGTCETIICLEFIFLYFPSHEPKISARHTVCVIRWLFARAVPSDDIAKFTNRWWKPTMHSYVNVKCYINYERNIYNASRW